MKFETNPDKYSNEITVNDTDQAKAILEKGDPGFINEENETDDLCFEGV
jgi:hypothetical protein